MTSPQPRPTATILPAGARDSEGLPVQVGSRIGHNGRTGTVVNVRLSSGVLVFTDDVDGVQRSAIIGEVIHMPEDEPAPTPTDLHQPSAPAANPVEADPLADVQNALAEVQGTLDALRADAGDPSCGEFVKAPGPCTLDRSAKHNWVEAVGGLPNYICQIARAVARGGHTLDSAIPIAVATVKRWAAGGGKVSAEVRARAIATVAEWEKKKAQAHVTSATTAVAGCEVLEFLAEPSDQLDELADLLELAAAAEPEVSSDEEGEFLVKPGTDLPPQAPSAARKARNYKRFPAGTKHGLGGKFSPGKSSHAKSAKAHHPAAKRTTKAAAPSTPEKRKIGSQEILIPAPPTHNGVKMVGTANDDGSARYEDGYVWDPIAGQFRQYIDQKTKKSAGSTAAVDVEDGNAMPVVASALSEYAPEDYSYRWNPETDEIFRVAEDQSSVDVFGPVGDEQTEPVWQSINPEGTEVPDILRLPVVEDQGTLENLLGGAFVTTQTPEEAHAALLAAAQQADPEVETPEGAGEGQGPQFRIPVVIPEGIPSGDRRMFAQGALEAKEPPMPLLWQRETDEGHKRSVVVGRIDSIQNLEGGGLGNAQGVFDTHPDAVEAARQVRGRFLTGVSGDVDQFEHELSEDEEGGESMLIKHGRLVAATLVAKPAFQEASIEIVPEEGEAPVIVASAGPLEPPAAWFAQPELDGPTQLSIDDSGRVYGHIAEWGTPHLGNPALKPPRSKQNYRYFNRKSVRTAEGVDVKAGQLTLIGGHAAIDMDPDRAVKHYDDTRSAVADVVAGEDEFGIWVAGAMRPDVSPEQIRAFRASEPSGDWRLRDGNLELCAVCQVNVPGFPVNSRPRAMVASGEIVALVAAGMIGYTAQRESLQQQVEALMQQVTVQQQQISNIVAEYEAAKRAQLAEIIRVALGQEDSGADPAAVPVPADNAPVANPVTPTASHTPPQGV